jgi:hypothetical protein
MANTNTDKMAVANMILAQLGGHRFLAMTGAKSLVGDETSLQFQLPPRSTKDGINSVRVELEPSDTYRVTFYKINRRSLDVATVMEHEMVYADELRQVFEIATGLRTSL